MKEYLPHETLKKACNDGIINLKDLKFYDSIFGKEFDKLSAKQRGWKNAIDRKIINHLQGVN